jgi:hypothetical protein
VEKTKELIVLIQDLQRWLYKGGRRNTEQWWELMIRKARLARKLALVVREEWSRKTRTAFILVGKDWEKNLRSRDKSFVYMACNDLTRHCYVGETGRTVKQRADEEITNAKNRETDFEKRMDELGTETWFWIPIERVRPGKDEKRRRLDREAKRGNELKPDLNMIPRKRGDRRKKKYTTRNHRTAEMKESRVGLWGKGTWFSMKETGKERTVAEGPDVGDVMAALHYDRDYILTARWGEDEGTGWKRARCLVENRLTLNRWKREKTGSCRMRGRQTIEVPTERLRTLATKRNSWSHHLRKVPARTLLDYWALTEQFPHQERRLVRHVLRQYQRKGMNLPTQSELVVRVRTTRDVDKSELRRTAMRHVIEDSSLTKVAKAYMKEGTRVVMTRGKTIRSMLTNYYKTAENYDEWTCAGPPWSTMVCGRRTLSCEDEGHGRGDRGVGKDSGERCYLG